MKKHQFPARATVCVELAWSPRTCVGSPWGAWFPPTRCALWVNQCVYIVPASVSVGVSVRGTAMGGVGHPVHVGAPWRPGLAAGTGSSHLQP